MRPSATLRKRLWVAIFVPTSVALVFIAAVFVRLQWNHSYDNNVRRLQTLAQVVAESSASSLAFRDTRDASEALAVLHAESSVLSAALFDEQGATFETYRSGPGSVGKIPGKIERDGIARQERQLTIATPVTHAGKRYGTLFVQWDLSPLYAEMRTYALTALVLLAGSFLLALFIARVLQRSISGPVLELAETARAVADKKNYALRVGLTETTELNTLATAFNHMLAETQATQAKLALEVEATRKAERALRSSEENMRLITDATPALISYIGADLRYKFANKQYLLWFGMEPETILGKTMTEVIGAGAFANLRPYVEAALRGDDVHFEAEAPYHRGKTRWINAHYIPHRDPTGTVLGMFVLVLDITDRKRIEDELARAHAALEAQKQSLEVLVSERTVKLREVIEELEAFSYSIAHDMRAPLRSMQGFSRLLLEDHAGGLNDEGRSFLQRIVASADRLDRLIRDVLNYSKIVRADLQLEVVDLQKLVEEIVVTYPHLQAPHADIQIAAPLPRVLGNTAALTQVISNLLGNAVKFVKPGVMPRVRIYTMDATPHVTSGTAPQPWIRLVVEDNGIGIPKDSQHRVFGMFQRLNRPELFEGTGIGLAIVRKAVERMGGSVGLESDEQHGSKFWVKLKRDTDA